ncbi:MAG: exodeoxyribonuclease V subunit gamma [Thiomicrospira sp.]|jgi:exodeoxyribonuclease V gamma subunit|nr:exodeoxyribonuclease V subunit gamma [Thiomicrospira sp.]
MLTLHTSNKTENLLAHLTQVIRIQPLSSPFARDVFLIQSQGMERWLSQRLADAFGVSANSDFLFPSKFFDHIARHITPEGDSDFFQREQLMWRLEARLRDLSHTELAPLQAYLQGEQLAIKRFGLAQQLAQVFDQYQLMRVDLLERWQVGQTLTSHPAEIWQRRLWLDLIADTEQPHRGQAWLRVIERLKNTQPHNGAFTLPERISVFGLTTMAPLLLDFLHALARHTQVHLYLMQPCEHYWGDIRSGKQMRIERLQTEQLEHLGDINHPLLSLLGQQGREFQQMILERGELDWEFDSFEPFGDACDDSPPRSALVRLQNSLLEGQHSAKIAVEDDSIQLVNCHSPMRELEVLKDALLQQLDQDPSLELRDILVMAPDISVYEPFISAVFDHASPSAQTTSSSQPTFRYAIADRSLRSSNELLDTLINLLNLLSSRFEWHAVLDILERESVYPRFDLDADSLAYIRSWVEQTHIRWGRDGAHRQQLHLPALEQNTWHAGLSQMMWGFVKQGTGLEIEGSAAQALGGLDAFVREVLFDYAERTSQPLSLQAWTTLLLNLIDKTLQDNAYHHLTPLRDMVQRLAQMPSNETYPLSVIVRWLDLAAGEHKTSQGFLAGQLTFCSMLPMRSIPFKMIAILGLNDGDFPKIDRHPSFDLMGLAGQFRQGDRSARRDDRYQFLDAILSARQTLYLSYVGQSMKTNDELAPSVVVSELRDVLALTALKQPLHGFSQVYFAPTDQPNNPTNARLRTYQPRAARIAQAFAQSQRFKHAPRWWQGAIRAQNSDENADQNRSAGLPIEELLRFARDPQLYFMQNVVGIRFDEVAHQQRASEPFALDGLENYHLNQRLLAAKLKGEAQLNAFVERLQHTGEWLSGQFGSIKLDEQLHGLQTIAALITDRLTQIGEAQPADWLELDLPAGRLNGWREHYQHGQLHYRYSKLKPKDYVQAWLWHLTDEQPTWLIGLNKDNKPQAYAFTPLDQTERMAHLNNWLQTYQHSLTEPSALILEAAWAYVSAKKPENAERDALNALREKVEGQKDWAANTSRPPKAEIALLYQGIAVDDLYSDAFLTLTAHLITPIWQALNDTETSAHD